MNKAIKFFGIRVFGIIISMITLCWMPWCIRVKWARLIYFLTYVVPRKFPSYMQFIEETNAKYQMGKRTRDAYKNIVLVRESHLGK